MKIKTCFSQKPLFLTKLCLLAFRFMEMKICCFDAGHMTKIAAMPIYGRNLSKIFLTGTGWPISTKLGM